MAKKEYIERVNYCKNICLCSEDKCEKDKCPIWCVSTADVAPVRHGRWIDAYPDIEPNPMFMYGICSECGFEQAISKYLNYCPDCGAYMRGEEVGNAKMESEE